MLQRSERILVVDDDDSIRHIVRICLSEEGYNVLEASNGRAALACVERYQPNLILLDLRMPIMDGWEFARQYRLAAGPHAPIIAFVAAFNAADECSDIEIDGILSKPFDLDDLLSAVRSRLPLAT